MSGKVRVSAPAITFACALALGGAACPAGAPIADPRALGAESQSVPGACAGRGDASCGRAQGLLAAAGAFGNVRHEYLLDPASTMAPGRCIERERERGGGYTMLPTRCALERAAAHATPPSAKVDASTIDFSFVGVAIDGALVSADADLTPWLSLGGEASEHKIALVALAFVRDLDPQFFGPSDEVAFTGEACSCGRATHFVGAVKMGGLLSYEMRVRSAELHGHALELMRAKVATGDTRLTQTVIGGLEVDGIDALVAASSPVGKPLGFRVKSPVPIAYAVYPLSDVCKFAFPAPEVSPETLDLGDVPYDREETRYVHVVNRAAFELRASIGERTFAVGALGSADIPITVRPSGTSTGCEVQSHEETIVFAPRDEAMPVSPRGHSTRVTTRVRTGKPTYRRHEHIDTGVHRKPDYAATSRAWTCPDDYAVASCRTEKAECSDGRCATDGYAVNAAPGPNGCLFACRGPEGLLPGISANFCRFDAVMECRLRCR